MWRSRLTTEKMTVMAMSMVSSMRYFRIHICPVRRWTCAIGSSELAVYNFVQGGAKISMVLQS